MTLRGGSFAFDGHALVALTRLRLRRARITGPRPRPVPRYTPLTVSPGEVLEVAATRRGARAYLSIRGGLDLPPLLGSRSTHLLCGLGGLEGRALRRGDLLPVGADPGTARRRLVADETEIDEILFRRVLRVTRGPEHSLFTPESAGAFDASEYEVTEEADRMGLRLRGPALARVDAQPMITEGVCLGAVQVPESGAPIILFVDQQTTGGYPRIASVISADLPALGQLRPRERVLFPPVTIAEAHALLRAQERLLARGRGREPAGAAPAWVRTITARQWKVLLAGQVGWMLDAMDVMLYAFALTAIQAEFSLGSAQAGALASVTLVASAIGGIVFGVLSDRYGRARMLVVSILVYSAFTGATATARNVAELVLWRTLVGFGLGGEWTAGSVLVAETWPAEHRGKAIGLMQSGWAIGYVLAAGLAALLLPKLGWRPLFLVGFLPALLALWIRWSVPEPDSWTRHHAEPRSSRGEIAGIFRPPLLRTTLVATATATALLFAYWGLFTWIPTYLASPVERGGAGLGITRSFPYIAAMQAGAFLGYVSFGALADRFGRRRVFVVFVLAAAVLVPVFGLSARSATTLLLLGPLVGFFGHGYFSVFGALLAELFPTRIRATAQGFCYNAGRAVGAAAPWIVGGLADRYGIGSALTVTSVFFVVSAISMLLLPETRGRVLA
jgi:biotin-dependent carboxylase-like uncharacterized protein